MGKQKRIIQKHKTMKAEFKDGFILNADYIAPEDADGREFDTWMWIVDQAVAKAKDGHDKIYCSDDVVRVTLCA
tara:strand:- start:575 stop:796 length:222 start_codon:yes stop_codon:yes gene_type:complete